jgi:hypothetical protein
MIWIAVAVVGLGILAWSLRPTKGPNLFRDFYKREENVDD